MQDMILETLKKCGCLDFITRDAGTAWLLLRDAVPEGTALLTKEAHACLIQNYEERMYLIYLQVLLAELRESMKNLDPIGMLVGKPKEASVVRAAGALDRLAGGNIKNYLHNKYPLLQDYQTRIHENYVAAFTEFLRAFVDCQKEISIHFFDNKKIHQIQHLSTGGADVHRNGRCVIGVTTDAGVVYYKPHSCGLDSLFHHIVNSWFSDCTRAAEVLEGEEFAFVSFLKHEPVETELEIATYYEHFGMLTALFHGLGSTDMHQENIISCGSRPTCVDVETILATPETWKSDDLHRTDQRSLEDSLLRTGILPVRAYKGPLVSPLYTVSGEATSCLPAYGGKMFSVEGYESAFLRGFRKGYARMFEHRDEIRNLVDAYRTATIRCVLKNTQYYGILRDMLFKPEYLTGEEARQKVRKKLLAPYKPFVEKADQEIINYEWNCLINGDIPYFCTTVGGRHLCGESPARIIKNDFYQVSALDSTNRLLNRLSEPEAGFEQELLRYFFRHAPVDEPGSQSPDQIQDQGIEAEEVAAEISTILAQIQEDVLHRLDGSFFWMSTSTLMDAVLSCGDMTSLGDVALFCVRLVRSALSAENKKRARELAESICRQMDKELAQWENQTLGKDSLLALIPTGLYTGWGGLLLACYAMSEVGIGCAGGLCQRIIHLLSSQSANNPSKTSVSEGVAGLLLALCQLPPSEEGNECIRRFTQLLLAESSMNGPQFSQGWAGVGMALAAAYDRLRESEFADGAFKAFQRVWEAYDSKLPGWPDITVRPKWLAGKGPYAAGIVLATDFVLHQPGMSDYFNDAVHLQQKEMLCAVQNAARESMMNENTLLHSDTLDEGNALTALALLKAGEKTKCGHLLTAMIRRKRERGSFSIAPPGVRSTFDSSFWTGTVGVGYALIEYYDSMRS